MVATIISRSKPPSMVWPKSPKPPRRMNKSKGRRAHRHENSRRESRMTIVQILPHESSAQNGAVSSTRPKARPSAMRCSRTALRSKHACEKSCACTTCHVIVRGGALIRSTRRPGKEEDISTWPGADARIASGLPGQGARNQAGHRDSEIHHQSRAGEPLMRWTDSLNPGIQLPMPIRHRSDNHSLYGPARSG